METFLVQNRLEGIRENIKNICAKAGRNPQEIILIGVTKYTSVERVQEALRCGLQHVGENRVQDAQEKFAALEAGGTPLVGRVTRHMIGPLQSNKVKLALKIFDVIQSVDRLSLAEAIEKYAAAEGRTVDILIQVNCSKEPQKSGVAEHEALSLVEQVAEFSHLRVLGLMTMAAFVDDKSLVRASFRSLREIGEQVRQKMAGHPRVDMKYLSMGMSHDYPIALEEGANMIRVGSAIFGER
ncbi:MAG: YggS family pyridoxal phosphate-dependent enzyme [Candidatus Omnitrophica bacterium]|nr:YggS family pyridoxal phosphate-dependent enzyme [Candidatus Omnitrophota bacterium]